MSIIRKRSIRMKYEPCSSMSMMRQGEATPDGRGEARRGTAKGGEARGGEARQGERQGEARQSEARHGDARHMWCDV